MPITVICQSCGVRLKAPDDQAGRRGKCPKCQAAIELTAPPPAPANEGIIEAFRVAEPPVPVPPVDAIASATPAAGPDVTRPGKRRKKKRKKFLGRFSLPSIHIELSLLAPLLGLGLVVSMGYAGYYIVRYAMRMPPPAVIEAEKWQTVEVPDRIKCLLPGPFNRTALPVPGVAGVQMIMYSCQPDKNSIYGVGYMEGELPAARRNLPAETLLNDACNGSIANTQNQGAVETGRESVQLGPFPGKQLTSDIARAGAKTVSRAYLAHGRIYVVMAGAVGLETDHANVKRLFDSFEILDEGGPPQPQGKPEVAAVPPAPNAAPGDKPRDKASSPNQQPNSVGPAIARRRDRKEPPLPLSRPAVVEVSLPPLPPPVPIKPPHLAKDVVVLDQPAPIDALAVGGGGRFLIFHCANQTRLEILDVNEGRVTRQVPLGEPKALFAAGMNDLLVALPNAHIIQRWGLLNFDRVTSAPLPFKGAVTGLSMGSASQGPLLVCEQADGLRVGGGHFLDVATLKPLPVLKEGERLPGIVAPLLRASGDGRVFAWRTSTGSEGHEMAFLVLRKDGAVVRTRSLGDYLLTPSPDGRYIYGVSGVLNHDWEPVFPRPANHNLYRPYIPAVQGPYFLQLLSLELDRPSGRTGDGDVIVFQRGSNAEVARVADVKGVTGMSLAYGTVGTVLAYDQRILFIPDAHLLVHIPGDRSNIILRRLDVEQELEKSGQDYLLIASEPPATAKRGQAYAYPMAVKSKKTEVSYRLETGPPGMAVTKAGVVAWQVPADFTQREVDVIVSVSTKNGKEQFQSFRITVE